MYPALEKPVSQEPKTKK